jgi:hypothetical protein
MTSYVITTPVNGTFMVPDDQIETAQTSINLIGRGVTNYGQAVAQNEINMLSNFAGPTPPPTPLLGQLWYNSTNSTLQLYTAAGTWSQMAFESDLANYATLNAFNNLQSAVNNLAATSATQAELVNYVTTSELYSPSASSPIVPYTAGGTGIKTIGSPNQVLTVNGMGTGYTFSSPQNFYRRPFVSVSTTSTLLATQIGSIINVSNSGITVNLPAAVQCQQGTSFIFTLSVTSGSITIQAHGTDSITSGKNVQGSSFTLYAGEEAELASDGVLKWITSSWSRDTATTPPLGDNTNSIATTQFVQETLGAGIVNPAFGVVSAVQFRANEGVFPTGTQFLAGYSFTGDGDNDTGMFSPSDGDLHLYSQGVDMAQINTSVGIILKAPTVIQSTLSLTSTSTAVTPAAGDSSTNIATTAFVTNAVNTAKLTFTPVQQGGGINQLTNKVYIGWSGTQLLCTVDATNLGNILVAADFTNLQNQITNNNNNLQAQITNNYNGQAGENNNLQSQISNNYNAQQGEINSINSAISAVTAPNTTGGYGIGNYQLVEQGSTGSRGAYVSPLQGQGYTIYGGTWMNCGGGQTDNNNWDLWVRIA